MNRERAEKLLAASTRFRSRGGRLMIREVQLVAAVAAVRAEREARLGTGLRAVEGHAC